MGTADSSPNKTMYDFTSSINRACTGSIKIDMAPEPVKGSGLVPLTIADQEFAVAPEISDAVCKAAAPGIYGYTYADSEYRSAVNSWMLRRHNWNISKHKLFTVNGVVTALGIAVRALTTEGDGIVIQPPVYPPFAGTVRKNNRILVENPLILRSNTYEIDFDRLYEDGYRGVIFDIDNTLVPHGAPADERACALFAHLKELGYHCMLLSNNKEPRVKMFNDAVQVSYIYKAGKPNPANYRKAMEQMGTDEKNTLFVGDQIFTDVYGANRTGIRTILVKPIHPKEEIQIVLKRYLEKIVLFFYQRKCQKQQRAAQKQ